jgi:4-hydroxybenzoyl-CoA thioesterase
MKLVTRKVRFHEIDAAQLVFFGTFMTYAHEAMEELFAELKDGYHGLVQTRKVGLPAVHVEADYRAPLRFGDTVDIEIRVSRLGKRSANITYRMIRHHDQVESALIQHTVVTTDLEQMCSCEMPVDVRAILEQHYDKPPTS